MNFDVQWSPGTLGVLSTSSTDGKFCIYNIEVGHECLSFLRKISSFIVQPLNSMSSFECAFESVLFIVCRYSGSNLLTLASASPIVEAANHSYPPSKVS
jgi:hypothetical protein